MGDSMNYARLASLMFASFFAFAAGAGADEPPNFTYDPRPPGTIVQSRVVYLAGEAMHSQWRAVLSKAPVGRSDNRTFYQWYLSIYAIDGTVYHLKYRSPRNPIPFDAVTKANGADLWFPAQDGSIAGVGELMGPGAQQVVITSLQAGADCGTARVDVLFQDAAMQTIMPTLSVENGCTLSAKVITDAKGTALAVTGPYYGPKAALCCPTKPKATAIFRFHNGDWTQTPKYFTVVKQP
jgi:hypothetical protein